MKLTSLILLFFAVPTFAGSIVPDYTRSQGMIQTHSAGAIWDLNSYVSLSPKYYTTKTREDENPSAVNKQYSLHFEGKTAAENLTVNQLLSFYSLNYFEDGEKLSESDYTIAVTTAGYRLSKSFGLSLANRRYNNQIKEGSGYSSGKGSIDFGASYKLTDRLLLAVGVEQIEDRSSDILRPYFGLGYTSYSATSREGVAAEILVASSKDEVSKNETNAGETKFESNFSFTKDFFEGIGRLVYSHRNKITDISNESKTIGFGLSTEFEKQEGPFKGVYAAASLDYSVTKTENVSRHGRTTVAFDGGYRKGSIDLLVEFAPGLYSYKNFGDATENYKSNTYDYQLKVRYNF